jgi:hypothetical protein
LSHRPGSIGAERSGGKKPAGAAGSPQAKERHDDGIRTAMSHQPLWLCILVATACDCGSASTAPAASTTPTASPATGSGAAEPTTASRAEPGAAEAPDEPTGVADPRVIRMSMPTSDGTFEYTADLVAGSLAVCQRRADGCEPLSTREGPAFRDDWRATVGRLATAARDATCPAASGPTVRIEIDDVVREIELPAYPEDRDYFPPEGDALTECAPRELARTVAIYLAWE